MGRVILPKTVPQGSLVRGPLFFLAGPIRGGDDWQWSAFSVLNRRLLDTFTAVIPCRYGEEHPLQAQRLRGNETRFARQTDWERHYMAKAAFGNRPGCLVFWLPCESATHPRPPEEGPYARDTYGELGEWRGRLMSQKLPKRYRIVIGAEEGFPGLSQIRRNFDQALGRRYDVGFSSTLTETLDLAIARAREM